MSPERLALTLFFPAFNEEKSLKTLLPAAKRELDALGVAYEILLVDGGSSDATAEVARGFGCRVLRQEKRGFGGAVRDGLEQAQGDYVLEFDADGSHPPEMIPALWKAREQADLVIASRYMKGGSAELSLGRRVLSGALNLVTRAWFGWDINDASSGLRIYRRKAVESLALSSTDFTIQQETLAGILGSGGRAAEIPFHYGLRVGGESKARVLPLAVSYLRMLWRLKLLLEGRTAMAALGAVLFVGLVTGFWGIDWGLPGPARLRAFPERLKPTPEIARKFADTWAQLYNEMWRSHREMRHEEPVTYVQGVDVIAPGWDSPPSKLLNSYRSMLLRSENPDERKAYTMLAQMRPWKLEFEPLYVHYGGAFIYPLGAFLGAASVAHALRLVSDMAFYILHPEQMRRLYLCGRLFILLFQLSSLWAVFALGRRLGGWKTGFIAALLFAACPVVVSNTHVLKPHSYSAFWTLAASAALLSFADKGLRRDALLCGFCAGMAVGANLGLLFVIGLPLLAYLERRFLSGKAAPGDLAAAFWGCAAGGFVLLLTNPYLALAFKDFTWERTILVQPIRQFAWTNLTVLPWNVFYGLGLPLGLACAIAAVRAAFWAKGASRLLGIFGLGGFIVFWVCFGFDTTRGSLRIYLPFIGLFCVLVADFLRGLPRAIKILALAAALGDAGLRSFVLLENMRRDAGPQATRAQAADWVEAHVPEGAMLGFLNYPEPGHAPALRFDRYRLVVFDNVKSLTPKSLPDYIVGDQTVYPEVSGLAGYEVAAGFQPYRLAWAWMADDSNFANIAFYIFKRKT